MRHLITYHVLGSQLHFTMCVTKLLSVKQVTVVVLKILNSLNRVKITSDYDYET